MTKMKGLLKGIKLISQIFVYKEHEMEIGYPTDVKHVAHIGWDNNESGNSPSWMNEFKTASEFSSASLSNFDQHKENPLFEGKPEETPWARKDFDQPNDLRAVSALLAEVPCSDKPKTPKKVKRKKIKSSSPTAPSISPRGHKTRGFRGLTSSEEQMELWTKFK